MKNRDIEAKRLGNSVKGPEVTHTPTPWKFVKEKWESDMPKLLGTIRSDAFGDSALVGDYKGVTTAFVAGAYGDHEDGKAEANAEFIVRAVNEYEELKKKVNIAKAYSELAEKKIKDLQASHEALLASLKTSVHYLKFSKLDKEEIALFEKDIAQAEGR